MNFTSGNTLPNAGKRINWPVVTLAGGLAVAMSVIAGLGVTERDSAPVTGTAIRSSAPVAAPSASQASPRGQVIIVESQAYADDLELGMATDQMATAMQGYEVPFQQTSFVVIDSLNKQAIYNEALADQTAFGFDILDLRGASIPEAPVTDSGATLESSAEALPTLYVVETTEQGAATAAAMDAEKIVAVMAGDEVPLQAGFLVVSTPEDELALNETIEEQLLLPEPAIEIVDLRD